MVTMITHSNTFTAVTVEQNQGFPRYVSHTFTITAGLEPELDSETRRGIAELDEWISKYLHERNLTDMFAFSIEDRVRFAHYILAAFRTLTPAVTSLELDELGAADTYIAHVAED